jgi:hypothetical protein
MDALLKLRIDIIQAEISHLLGFMFVFIFLFIHRIINEWELGLIILKINLLLNIHLILIQQQTKRWIDRNTDKFNSYLYSDKSTR